MEHQTIYAKQRKYANAFDSQFIRLLERHGGTVNLASDDLDQNAGIDAIWEVDGKTITLALRVRENKYRKMFGADLPIRTKVSSGGKTEWDKILDGKHADYMILAWAENNRIVKTVIIDLTRLSSLLPQYANRKELDNHDGTKFRAIPIRTLPPDCFATVDQMKGTK